MDANDGFRFPFDIPLSDGNARQGKKKRQHVLLDCTEPSKTFETSGHKVALSILVVHSFSAKAGNVSVLLPCSLALLSRVIVRVRVVLVTERR